MNVMCIIGDGFEELEAIATLALFRRAGLTIDIYTLDGSEATGRFNMTLTNLKRIDEVNIDEYKALFIPGGPHYKKLENDARVTSIIHKFYEDNKIIGAICAGPTILGKLGLLKNREYTCFTSMNEDFKGTYKDQYTVIDGNVVTGRSAAASIDFAFAFMDLVAGKQVSDRVKKEIYYDN